jgi:hypothetical protein
MRKALTALSTAALALAISASVVAAAAGPPSLAFYIDGARYRTVGTPTDLLATGAPESSFDHIYALGSGLINVAESKPGDTDFNGGRWLVMPITWSSTPVQLTSAEQVYAYRDAGLLTVGTTPVKAFVCTVNQVPGSH